MQCIDIDSMNLKTIANSFGLDLHTFLSLPKEYRDALIHGGIMNNRKFKDLNNSVSSKKIIKKKMLLLLRKNK